MKGAIALLFGLGVIAALSATVLVTLLMVNMQDEPEVVEVEREPETGSVLVAGRDLSAMEVIRTEDVRVEEVPKEDLPEEALTAPMYAVGKVVASSVMEGQMITPNAFVREGTGVHLASSLPDGKRAVAISLTDTSGLEGLLYPGSVVDVYVDMEPPEDEGVVSEGVIATTLLENVQVLGVGRHTVVSGGSGDGEDAEEGSSVRRSRERLRVTLQVDPDEAKALQLAMRHGSVSLALRNPFDDSPVAGRSVSLYDLAGINRTMPMLDELVMGIPAEEEPVDEGPAWETMIIRGVNVEQKSFGQASSSSSEDGEADLAGGGATGAESEQREAQGAGL